MACGAALQQNPSRWGMVAPWSTMMAWSPLASGTTADLHDVWGTSPSDIFAVGNAVGGHAPVYGQGGIFHWDGRSWTQMQSGVDGNLFGVMGCQLPARCDATKSDECLGSACIAASRKVVGTRLSSDLPPTCPRPPLYRRIPSAGAGYISRSLLQQACTPSCFGR